MKRMQELLVIVLLAICSQMSAEPVTRQQAQQKAQAFLQKEGKTISVSQLRRAPARDQNAGEEEVEPYYVFNVGNNDGFVFVAGDDLAPDILGYSTRGHFDIDEIPENMKAWLDGYAEQIEFLRKHPSAKRAEATNREEIEPLLKTQWGQGEPYNCTLPTWNNDDEERVPTGCVATAMAQIMKYYEHPQKNTTSIPEYEASIFGEKSLLGYFNKVYVIGKHLFNELPPIIFDWGNMLDYYKKESPNYTFVQALAVADLMRYCAQACHMDYYKNTNEGGTEVVNWEIFGYTSQKIVKQKDGITYITDEEWEETIYNELKEGRPVFYGATSKNHIGKQDGKHAFVVDV